jgi:FkbM family methyltransferase
MGLAKWPMEELGVVTNRSVITYALRPNLFARAGGSTTMRKFVLKVKASLDKVSPYVLVSRGHLAHADFVVRRHQTLGASSLREYARSTSERERSDLARFLETMTSVLKSGATIDSQLLQDVFALTIANDRERTFVEVGAAKPRELSNTALLQDVYGWTGVLVEPNPRHVSQLLSRAEADRVSVEPFAVGPAGRVAMVDADELSAVIDAPSDPTHAAARGAALRAGRIFEVDRKPLRTVLEKRFGSPKRIGFLSVDVEGAEVSVIQSNDWKSWSFWAIALEHNYRDESLQIYDRVLLDAGYRPFLRGFSAWDSWYVHDDWI